MQNQQHNGTGVRRKASPPCALFANAAAEVQISSCLLDGIGVNLELTSVHALTNYAAAIHVARIFLLRDT